LHPQKTFLAVEIAIVLRCTSPRAEQLSVIVVYDEKDLRSLFIVCGTFHILYSWAGANAVLSNFDLCCATWKFCVRCEKYTKMRLLKQLICG